jgi:hypothetical protein
MLDYYDVEQNSDEWFEMRSGLVTSSKLGLVMANYGKSFGEPAKKYAVNVAIEQITGAPISDGYSNAHTERGHEQEPVARYLYEEETFCSVSNGGFFCDSFFGDSPDGLVGKDGCIEIKSVIPSVHFANIKRGCIAPAYRWQCIGHLMFTGREWLDFISYCEQFPEDKKLYTYRIYRDSLIEEFSMLSERLDKFLQIISDAKKTILTSNYQIN